MIVEELSMLAADSVRTISLFGSDFCGVFYRWGDFSLSEVFLWWSDLFQSDLFLCSTHTHLHLTRTSCSCGTRVSIYVCFSPSDLVTSRLDKKPEVAAGNGKWLQKYCGRQSLQLRIKCSFLSNIRMLFWDLWWQGRAANFVMNKILRRIALDVTGQEKNPLELLMTHTQST